MARLVKSIYFGTILSSLSPTLILASPSAATGSHHPAFEGGGICEALLSQGIRDDQSVNITEARFNEIRSQVCSEDYSTYQKAQLESASGGLDVPGYFGVSASDANADSEYSAKLSQFCNSDYGQSISNTQIRTYVSTINQGILNSFDHCVDVNAERFVRYVQAEPDGNTFYIVFKNLREGAPEFTIDDLTIIDTTTGRTLSVTHPDCNLPHGLPYNTGSYDAIDILCQKPAADSVVVSGRTTAGLIDPISIPGITTAPPSVADEVTALQGQVAELKAKLATLAGSVQQDETALPFSAVLASFPEGTVLLGKINFPSIPSGWSTCPDSDHYLRVSPNPANVGVPGPGGSFDLSVTTDNNGFTYDGGHPADPGNDTRRSPPAGEKLTPPFPAFTYVSCMTKN